MTKYEISKMCGSGWILEIYKDGICIHESQHPSHAYAKDAAKAHAK